MMLPGFLPYSRATFVLDFVAVALVAIVPALLYSIHLSKIRRRFGAHKNTQIVLAAILAAAVVLFEVDIRLNGWRHLAEPSPYYGAPLETMLWIHLTFAVTTPVLWIVTIVYALRRFSTPAAPGPHSSLHKTLGWASTADMIATAATGWVFYYMAFVAV
ncbi:MAG: DUF420 domain-containing protein [Planctomycetia bacterium]